MNNLLHSARSTLPGRLSLANHSNPPNPEPRPHSPDGPSRPLEPVTPICLACEFPTPSCTHHRPPAQTKER